jgi:hypothetical protein
VKAAALALLLATVNCSGLCGGCPPGEWCLPQGPCAEWVDSAICGRFCAGRNGEPFRYYYGACTRDGAKVAEDAIAKCKSTGLEGCASTVCAGCEVFASPATGCGRANAN